MAKHFFQKEQVNTKINGLNGVSVPFEVLPGNTGVLVLDDSAEGEKTLASLLKAIVGRMGVRLITEQEYLEIKKKRLSVTFAPRSKDLAQPIRVQQAPVQSRPRATVAPPAVPSAAEPAVAMAAPANGDAPPSAPAPYVPRRGRPPKIKAPVRASMAPVHEEIVRIH